MVVFLRKMLGIGRLPDDLRGAVAGEGIIHLEECVAVTFRFSGNVPGVTAKGKISSYVGALALTSERVLATLSSVPKRAGRAVDHRWNTDGGTMVRAAFDESGLTLRIDDISVVDPQFAGSLLLHYKSPLNSELIARLPERSFAFDVPARFVYAAVGVARCP